MQKCIVATTADKYELPIAIADSFPEMDKLLRLTEDSSEQLVKNIKYTARKYHFKIRVVCLRGDLL